MEHGMGDFRDLVHQLQAIDPTPAVPLVRVAFNEPWLVKRTLDLGPSGLLIPFIQSAEQAKQAVRAMRYPPEGIRGVITVSRPTVFGAEFQQYRTSANDLLLTVIQVELKEAMNDIEAIAAIPEVDVLFVGPVDLTTSLGVPNQLNSDVAQAALRRIEQAARKHSKAIGILLPNCESATEYKERGYQFLGVGSDAAFLNQAARSAAQSLKSTAE
jgi:2-keto-3-deoxy-L-rhamnonate aldolase RhmA